MYRSQWSVWINDWRLTKGVSAVLTKIEEKWIRPVAYVSHKLLLTEQGYSPHERELLGIVLGAETSRPFPHVLKFTILTDHHPSKYLESQKSGSRKLARWVEFMHKFNYDIRYIEGKANPVADALSRKDREKYKVWGDMIRKLFSVATVIINEIVLQMFDQ